MKQENKKINYLLGAVSFCILAIISTTVLAGDAGVSGIGKVAGTITGSFENLGKLITAGSYLAGLGFSIGAIMKFKQHKDNPTQIPIGTPIALIFIGAALLFLPSILTTTGQTLFGQAGGVTAGHGGTNIGGPAK